MHILVTGGAGFIGSHVVDTLIARGHAVTVLDDLSSGKKSNLQGAIETGKTRFIEGSVLDIDAVSASLDGIDGVVHMAVQCVRRSIGDPIGNHTINATGTLNVLEASRRANCKRFLYCSSSEVYGNSSSERLDEDTAPLRPTTVYGASKLAGECYARAYFETYGMNTMIVRPFNAYGPREHDEGDLAEVIPLFVIRVLCGEAPVIFGDGTQGRDFTYVGEIATGLADVLLTEGLSGQVMNLAFGRMITIKEVAEQVMKALGANDLSIRYMEKRIGDVYQLHAATDKAEKLIGYRAQIPLAEGLQRYIEWFRLNRPAPEKLLRHNPINWNMPDSKSLGR